MCGWRLRTACCLLFAVEERISLPVRTVFRVEDSVLPNLRYYPTQIPLEVTTVVLYCARCMVKTIQRMGGRLYRIDNTTVAYRVVWCVSTIQRMGGVLYRAYYTTTVAYRVVWFARY